MLCQKFYVSDRFLAFAAIAKTFSLKEFKRLPLVAASDPLLSLCPGGVDQVLQVSGRREIH